MPLSAVSPRDNCCATRIHSSSPPRGHQPMNATGTPQMSEPRSRQRAYSSGVWALKKTSHSAALPQQQAARASLRASCPCGGRMTRELRHSERARTLRSGCRAESLLACCRQPRFLGSCTGGASATRHVSSFSRRLWRARPFGSASCGQRTCEKYAGEG